jgi:hypothetical protein
MCVADIHPILRFLRDLEAREAGYEYEGIRGWAGVSDVCGASGVWLSSERLRDACVRQVVDRVDARVPGSPNPFYIYRISENGVADLAAWADQPCTRQLPPRCVNAAEVRAFLAPGAAAALDALQHARSEPTRREWVPDEPAWRTSRELTEWLKAEGERTGVQRVFFSDELQRLVRYRLAERRDKPKPIYRITEAGIELKVLQWTS